MQLWWRQTIKSISTVGKKQSWAFKKENEQVIKGRDGEGGIVAQPVSSSRHVVRLTLKPLMDEVSADQPSCLQVPLFTLAVMGEEENVEHLTPPDWSEVCGAKKSFLCIIIRTKQE